MSNDNTTQTNNPFVLTTGGAYKQLLEPSLQSTATGELMKALLKATARITGAKKDHDNPGFRTKYADLGSVFDACKTALTEAGIVIVQQTDDSIPPAVIVTTTLHHADSGQWIGSRLRMHAVKTDPQAIGSAITYARRYTLSCIAGIVSEDDDGNAASGRNDPPLQTRVVHAAKPPAEVIHRGRETVITAGTIPAAPPLAQQAAPLSLAARKAAAMAILEKHIGAPLAADTLEAIKKQNTNNDARLAALEAAAALYKDKA